MDRLRTYLGKYDSNRSAKTCPGTNFWGKGCSKDGFAWFIKDIKDYVDSKKEEPKKDEAFKQYIARCTTDELNCRKGPGTQYDIETQLDKGVVITIVLEARAKDGSTWCKAKSGYWVNKKYLEFVKYV